MIAREDQFVRLAGSRTTLTAGIIGADLEVDGRSAHHPNAFPTRLQGVCFSAVAVRLLTHSSWLNQIGIFFSIVQRKVLVPIPVTNAEALTVWLLACQDYDPEAAKPFSQKVTALSDPGAPPVSDLLSRYRLTAARAIP